MKGNCLLVRRLPIEARANFCLAKDRSDSNIRHIHQNWEQNILKTVFFWDNTYILLYLQAIVDGASAKSTGNT